VEATIVVNHILGASVVSENPDAKEIRINEAYLWKTKYTETYFDVRTKAKEMFSDFVQNSRFHNIMAEFRKDPNLHKVRYLDPGNEKSQKKDYYSKEIYAALSAYYTLKNDGQTLEKKHDNDGSSGGPTRAQAV
jgi:hypothetical protein